MKGQVSDVEIKSNNVTAHNNFQTFVQQHYISCSELRSWNVKHWMQQKTKQRTFAANSKTWWRFPANVKLPFCKWNCELEQHKWCVLCEIQADTSSSWRHRRGDSSAPRLVCSRTSSSNVRRSSGRDGLDHTESWSPHHQVSLQIHKTSWSPRCLEQPTSRVPSNTKAQILF